MYEININSNITTTDYAIDLDFSNVNLYLDRLIFYQNNNIIPHYIKDYNNKIVTVKLNTLDNNTTIYAYDNNT